MTNLLRAFIAIEIPTEIKKTISVQTANLQREAGRAVRWVTSENTHLTLKFLGELSPANMELLTQALENECSLQVPFEISVRGVGCFPNSHRPRVIWVGLNSPPDLERLQHRVEAAAARLGYAPEERPFSAHLTIGRVREQASQDEMKKIEAALAGLKIGELGRFTASTVTLFKSELQPSGPHYTPLFSAGLGN
ncbi:MAG TPA: RNA 2',3'-cyclic phosphodiesterase [Anaerolineales bacterium]|jgi:2'-5' RNA ligase